MKVKFNRYERLAGLFVGGTLVAAVGVTILTGIKQGWFESKSPLVAVFAEAEGIYTGTPVRMAGLTAGSVDSVELTPENQVRVRFSLKESFFARVRSDSKVQIVRPFLIGDKALDVSTGTPTAANVEAGTQLEAVESFDVMSLLSGKALSLHMATFVKMAESLRKVAEALGDPKRTESLIRTLDSIQPLVSSMTEMSRGVVQLTRGVDPRDVKTLVRQTVELTGEINKILPALNDNAPQLGQDLGQMSQQLAVLTRELAKLTPVLQEMGPQMPRVSRRAVEALDEAVVTLKAIQRTFLVRGAASEVKKEEAQGREPAESSR